MLQAVSELHRLLALLFTSNAMSSWNLGRSASSVGERHSVTFSLPLLPKRAETFGGFDHAAAAAAAAAVSAVLDLIFIEEESRTDSPFFSFPSILFVFYLSVFFLFLLAHTHTHTQRLPSIIPSGGRRVEEEGKRI